METKETLDWMKEMIEKEEAEQGITQHSKERLFILFEIAEKYSSDSLTLRESRHKAQLEADLEVLRSVFTYGQAALRTTIIINGGAAIAMLAFLARYVGTPSIKMDIAQFLVSLLIFGLGVFVGAFTTGFTYLTQYFYAHSRPRLGVTFHVVSLFLGIASILCFGVGIWFSYLGFSVAINA